MSNQQPKYTFGEDTQKRIVAMLMGDATGFFQNLEVIRPEFFENPVMQAFAEIIFTFYKRYQHVPRQDEFLEEVGRHLEKNSRMPSDEFWKIAGEVLALVEEGNFGYVKDLAKAWARFQAMKNVVIESVEIVKRQCNYEEIVEKARQACYIGEENADLGTFYFDQLNERLQQRAAGHTRAGSAIHTMISKVDRMLGGGLAKGELGVVMGPYKRGKTIVSVNFSVGALWDGRNVAHFIMEGSEERLNSMYDARISGIEVDRLDKHTEEVRKAVEEFKNNATNGRLYTKRFPALSCTPLKIEGNLAKLRLKGFVPDLLMIDYLGLMSSTAKMSDDSDRYLKFGQITKELLSLAQRGDYAVWLLHQTIRGSRTKETVDLEDSADSVEPMRDADIILTLNQTKEESEMVPAIMRFFLAGCRVTPDRRIAKVGIDKEKIMIFDVEEEDA